MQLHTLNKQKNISRKKRVGRGGKRGTYSGRGIKGQKARSGRKIRPDVRNLIKKIPMRKGQNFTGPPNRQAAIKAAIISKHFKKGECVTPKALVEKRLIKRIMGKTPEVKILNSGKYLDGIKVSGCILTGAKK